MTSLREAIRRHLRPQASDPSFDPRIAYRLYWTGQARTWAPARRAALLHSIATLLQEPDFEPNTYRRRYRIDGLDPLGHSGASLVALRDVLIALDEFDPHPTPMETPMSENIPTETLAETTNFVAWKAGEPDGEVTYHLELGTVTVHFFEEEWTEFLELVGELG